MNQKLPILMFHAISDGAAPICFPLELFKLALHQLHQRGYQTLNLSDAVQKLRAGSLPSKVVVLTFDDGDLSIYEKAWPELRKHSMTATVFLLPEFYNDGAARAPGKFEDRALINRAQVLELSKGGWEFGAHTITHPDLRRLRLEQIEQEMQHSKIHIERMLGSPVSSFSYPYGRYDSRCHQIAKRYFFCACTDNLALASSEDDLHRIPRVDAYYFRSERRIDLMFKAGFPWYLKARAIPRNLRRIFV